MVECDQNRFYLLSNSSGLLKLLEYSNIDNSSNTIDAFNKSLQYGNELKNKGINVINSRLLYLHEILGMFSSNNITIENIDGRNKLQSGYSWIYNISYWIRYSQNDYGNIFSPIYVSSDGAVRIMNYGQTNNFGVRPVITVSSSILK